jgi:hypothetical protein
VKRGNFWFGGGLALLCLSLVILALSCGGGGGGGGSSTGTVNTSISDPPTCQSTFPHVWVTITRVRAHTSANASESDSGWTDLLPDKGPWQIDLINLSETNTDCLLTYLGSTSGIPAGQYQQIRLYLLSNNPPSGTKLPDPNNCGNGNGFNCVVTTDDVTNKEVPHILELSSEAQTGIKIPSGQIAGGKFVVPAGKEVDLNIDFDACSSIVQQPDGRFRLKPVLHAAEVSLNNWIRGKVVVENTESGIEGAVVFLEQQDSDGIDRMIMQTFSKPDGTFIFCPVPSGNFDVVADALVVDPIAQTTTAYNATITFGVPSGTAMGNIPLIPEIGASPAQITGQITTTGDSGTTEAYVSVSALQAANNILVTIPPLEGSLPSNVTTQAGVAQYTLIVPASNPLFKEFIDPDYSGPADAQINYTVNARAFTIPTLTNPDSVPDCFPASLSFPVFVEAGLATLQDFPFTGCQ